MKIWTTTVLCVGFSLGVIVWAAATNHYADGGRGGALAVALAFFTLFTDRGTAARVFNRETKTTEQNVDNIRTTLAVFFDWQGTERIALTISSVVGTLAWGFGDVAAAMLQHAIAR